MWGSECRIKAIDDDVLNVANTPHISKLGFEQLLNAAKKAQEFADTTKFKDLGRNEGSKKSGMSLNVICTSLVTLKNFTQP